MRAHWARTKSIEWLLQSCSVKHQKSVETVELERNEKLKEKLRAAIMFFLIGAAMLLYGMRCRGNKKCELKNRIKSAIATGLCEFVKAVARVFFAFIYFHVFVAMMIAVLWRDIESFFETVLQGRANDLTLWSAGRHTLCILIVGVFFSIAFEFFLKNSFGNDADSVFETISWMGNTVLALIGILTIFYVLYPEGINGANENRCCCAETTLAQWANGYLWAEGFVMFFGVAILDFYKVLSGKNIKKRYRCQQSGCEIVEEISEDF